MYSNDSCTAAAGQACLQAIPGQGARAWLSIQSNNWLM